MAEYLPDAILNRKNKMGFPVPLTEWLTGDLNGFVRDIFSSQKSKERELINNKVILEGMAKESKFSRKIWGLLCIELWYQEFVDKESYFKGLLN